MSHAPIPTEEQLARIGDAIGSPRLEYSERLAGGLSCTLDVLVDGGTRLVLRRYGSWSEDTEDDVAAREKRALELVQSAGVPVPAPVWIDTEGIFTRQALIISYLQGEPDLTPSHPFEWAETLAETLARIHSVKVPEDDLHLFPETAGGDAQRIAEHPEHVLEHPLGEQLLRRRVQLGQHRLHANQVFSHADFWPGNILWRDGLLEAVVDWESPGLSEPDMDVAYCSLEMRYFGMDKVADRFIAHYREVSADPLSNLAHWEAIGLCSPMPDIGNWVPAWNSMGKSIDVDGARRGYTRALESFLERTA